MEVHPPHSPVRSIKDFMVHLLAITIGLLIALGLEASVEWMRLGGCEWSSSVEARGTGERPAVGVRVQRL